MTDNIEFISAGAGSGKTYSLTQRLTNLLSTGKVNPAGVIATTFTRRAAGELSERVRQALMKAGHRQLANQMEQAAISTVNSVCGDLLQRFAFEAGHSPEQQVLDETEARRLFSEALDTVLGDRMEQVRELNNLAQRLSIEDKGNPQWRQNVVAIANMARSNDCPPEQLEADAQSSVDELLSHFGESTSRDLNHELHAAIERAIDNIDIAVDTTKSTAGYLSLLRGAKRRLGDRTLPWANWVKLGKEKPAKRSEDWAEPVQTVARELDRHPQLHRDLSDYIHAVFRLARESLDGYQSLKRRQGLVDFVDQEQQLYHLLDNPHVQQTLKEDLQLLLVDEFQDTSPIQLALFLRLAALADKVIWVGDIKQAIYGFRGSDPSLMQAVVQAIRDGGGKLSRLTSSWRSRPALVEFSNRIFEQAFANTLQAEDVALDPAHEEQTQDFAVLTWNLDGKNNGERFQNLAAGMGDLVDQPYTLVDKHTRTPRPVRLGDIAVLCRSNNRLKEVASACAQVGIAVSYKRPGLLGTPECTLALASLRRLADPRDTLATAELITLGEGQSPEQWLPERIAHLQSGQPGAQWGEQGQSASGCLQQLARGRDRLTTLSPVEALNEAITLGQVRGTVCHWGPDEQRQRTRLANLDTLCQLAEEYQEHCEVRNLAATVAGLLMWLQKLQTAEEDWQATPQDDNSVTLSTYHGAKGLEWPVVIAIDLDSKVRPRIWGASVKAAEHFDAARPLADRALRLWPYPFGGQQTGIQVKREIEESPTGQRAHAEAVEEEKRLLYVTFTRARDLLVLPQPSNKPIDLSEILGVSDVFPEQSVTPQPKTTDDGSYRKNPRWFLRPPSTNERMPRLLTPSSTRANIEAVAGESARLGTQLALQSVEDMAGLGIALHGAITAAIQCPDAFTRAELEALLVRFDMHKAVASEDVAECSRRFLVHCRQRFTITRWLPEYPVSYVTGQGQEVSGFIDLLLETPEGWIIIDHKTAPHANTHTDELVQKYSGQLGLYGEAVESLTGKPVVGLWLHFMLAGLMVEVVLKDKSQ